MTSDRRWAPTGDDTIPALLLKAASRNVGLIGRLWMPAAADDRRLGATTAGEAMTA